MQIEFLLLFFLGVFFIFEAIASIVLGEKEFTGQDALRVIRIIGGFVLLFMATDAFDYHEIGLYFWVALFCVMCLTSGFVLARKL
jgi:hypothetical protein